MGTVLGSPGGSLQDASFAVSASAAQAGSRGEKLTADVLTALAYAPSGPTVLHDLSIPGAKANVDHAIVAGLKVLLLDSKLWKPGFYWTAPWGSYRGLQRVSHVDSKTMPMAQNRFGEVLAGAKLLRPALVVWPSRDEGLSMWALRLNGTRHVLGSDLRRFLKREGMIKPADPDVVHIMRRYVR